MRDRYRSWIEISKKNLLGNFSVFKKLAGRANVACVVKANAYGHGLTEIVSILKNRADLFAVDSLEEAYAASSVADNKPILILGYVPTFQLKEAVAADLSLTVYNLETLKDVASLKMKVKVHLKIETGLNRQGIKLADLPKFTDFVKKNKNIQVEGISTHFANIEDTLDPSFAGFQIANFKKALDILKKAELHPKYIHAAASAATIIYAKKTNFSLIRSGIGLYGLWPSRETRIAAKTLKKKIELKPVLSWKSIVAQVKEIKIGESVGYGRAWVASRDSKIAVVPIGYYDGFDRKLSNSGRVIIRGQYAPVVGRVAMNMTMVDVTEIPKVSLEDEVVIIGKQAKAEVTAEEIADKLGTINYEVVSRINPDLPRVTV